MKPVVVIAIGLYVVLVLSAILHDPTGDCEAPYVAQPGQPCRPPLQLNRQGASFVCSCFELAPDVLPAPPYGGDFLNPFDDVTVEDEEPWSPPSTF